MSVVSESLTREQTDREAIADLADRLAETCKRLDKAGYSMGLKQLQERAMDAPPGVYKRGTVLIINDGWGCQVRTAPPLVDLGEHGS